MSAHAPSNLVTWQEPAIPNDFIWRLTVDQYHDMVRAGILTDDDPVELLEGLLVTKMSKNRPHSLATRRTSKALEAVIPQTHYVDTQEPVTLSDSEPEPDVIVVFNGSPELQDRQPVAEEVALVVEVADSSLDRDRGIKKRLYAAAGIATYWIINLIDNRIEVYTNPQPAGSPPDYARREDFGPGSTIPVNIDNHVALVPVDTLLP